MDNRVHYGEHDDEDMLGQVNWLFSKKSLPKIMEAVQSNIRTNKLSQKIVQALEQVSFQAMQLNFQLVNKVQQADSFDTALQIEYQLMMRSLEQEAMFMALKAYVKGGQLDWTLYREELGMSQSIEDNYMAKEEETRCFQLDQTILDKSILDKRNEKGQVVLRGDQSSEETQEDGLLGQAVETQEMAEEWESSEREASSIEHLKEDQLFNSLLGNIHRSKADYDLYLGDIKTVLKATLSRQMYILQNRFKYLIEQLRKTKVSLATYNNKKRQLDKQMDDD